MNGFHWHPPPWIPYGGRRPPLPAPLAEPLEATGLSATIGRSGHFVFEGISMSCGRGTLTLLQGANGAGKTTLLKVLAGLIKPDAGRVSLFGFPPVSSAHRMAYLPQRSMIDWTYPMTAKDLVLSGRYVHHGWFSRPGVAERAEAWRIMERMGLAGLGSRRISQLSGGQQQRLLIARAISQRADLFLLDEPDNHLDTGARAELWRCVDDLRKAGKTILAAVHEAGVGTIRPDRVMFLECGRLRERSDPGRIHD